MIVDEIILVILDEFKAIHKDSHYIYPGKRGPIGTTLVFDIRNDIESLVVDVSILNTNSPKKSLKLIKDIEQHFIDRVILADDYMLKFDKNNPIASQNRVNTKSSKIEHIELTINVKHYKGAEGSNAIQITRVGGIDNNE